MIPDEVRSILTYEGPAALVTSGPRGPHLVATWQSYLELMDSSTLTFPAGSMTTTEENITAGSMAQMIIGAKMPKGVGYRFTGRLEFQSGTPVHDKMKERFPWCRAAVLFHVLQVEKVLG